MTLTGMTLAGMTPGGFALAVGLVVGLPLAGLAAVRSTWSP